MAKPSGVLRAIIGDLAPITFKWIAANKALLSNVAVSPDRRYTFGMPVMSENVDAGNQATVAVPYRGRIEWRIPFVRSSRDQGENLGNEDTVVPYDLTLFDVGADIRRIFYQPRTMTGNLCDDVRVGQVEIGPPDAASSTNVVMGWFSIVCLFEDDHRVPALQEP